MIDEQEFRNKVMQKINVILNDCNYNSDILTTNKLQDDYYEIAADEIKIAEVYINTVNDIVLFLIELNLCYLLKLGYFEVHLIDVFELKCSHGYIALLRDFLHSKVWDINVVIELLKCIESRA